MAEGPEAAQPKGGASKKKNKWKTVTAEFYQPKPYEADQGKGKVGGAAKGPTGKGGPGRGAEDPGAKGGRGGKGGAPQQDDACPPRLGPEEVAKQPLLDTSVAESNASGARGGGGENSPKRKPLGNKPRDAKGKGKSKHVPLKKGGPAFDATQDIDRSRPAAPVQPQGTGMAIRSGQPAMGLGQQPAMARPVQQMPQQGAAMPHLAMFGDQGFSAGGPGGLYQNAQGVPAMYAMPYYVPVQMAPAQMAVESQTAIYTASPPFVPAGGQPSGCGASSLGAPGVPGAALVLGAKVQQAPLAEGDRAALKGQVQQQIEYYFDGENLVKDMYLRRNMTEEGWVAVWLVAGFRRVQSMTTDMSLVVEAIQASGKVELDIQMQFVRPKDTWQQWVMGSAAVPPQREMPAGNLSGSVGST